jgi:hypothetical protein
MSKQKEGIKKMNKIIEELCEVKKILVRQKSELYLRTLLKF